jgi:hypothetical protein
MALWAGVPAGLAVALVVVLIASGTFGRKSTESAGGQADGRAPAVGPGVAGSSTTPAGTSAPGPAVSVSAGRTTGPGGGQARVGCELPKYPKPSCTGVPAGTKLTELPLNVDNDSYAIRKPNAVIDRVHIAGNLLIWAPGVTVTNSQIDGTVYNEQDSTDYPYTISDSTIGLPGKCITQPGLTYDNYTARRIKVLGHDDGFRIDTPGHVRVYDSYAKLCWNPPSIAPPDGSHSGGIQAECKEGVCHDSVFVHNTIDNRGPHGNSGMTYMSYAGNPTSGWTATDNLVMGGSYTVIFWWTGGPEYEVHDNRVVQGEWAYGPADTHASCAHQNWSGNTLVTIDANYDITSTVAKLPCVD